MKRIAFVLAFTLLWSPLTGQEGNRNLDIVRRNLRELQTRLDQLSSQSRSLSEEVEYYGAQLEVLMARREETFREKERTEADLVTIEKQLDRITGQIRDLREYLAERLKSLHRKEDYLFFEMLMEPDTEDQLVHSMNTFLHLAERDRQALTDLSVLRTEQEAYENSLKEKSAYLQQKLQELNDLHTRYRETYREKRSLYRKIRNETDLYADLVKQRNALMKDLINTLDDTPTPQDPSRVSIERFRALLSLPVKNGTLLERFGRVRNRKFGTYLKNNGITLQVAEGTPVHAFYDGVVVYAGWYKSYGRLIIVSHGSDYYSFYAHLKRFSVTINQVVATGDVIGESGNTASVHGDALHFELWHKREPQDPMKWVRRN